MDVVKVLLTLSVFYILFSGTAAAQFVLESVDVTVYDIKQDGTVKVKENIKLIIQGDYYQGLYDTGYSGYSSNDLAFWSSSTELKDVKRHINPKKGSISDFTLTPQPRGKCNPVQGICHGEIILEYMISPTYNETGGTPVEGTGLFTIDYYKPRTTKYKLNTDALSFTTTEQGNILLDERVYFNIYLPEGTMVTRLNPMPQNEEVNLPARMNELSWEGVVLVNFIVEFDVEKSLEREVSEFFFGFVNFIEETITGPYGFAIIIIFVIIVGSYLYINVAKRKKEE